ncbi:hypothetical protein AB0M50_55800 [Nonomuraea fuscirosea]|uniref:hypothetical protein n=1 Tax=Nonomuraea fuscirosea TaxID=1291556 RepID=UPI002DDA6B3E|nr:hypothetical protein [Nonomuraea fuscirosea]WSA50838.1 hypothetical protein OIE67_43370 [Nonomuraea fuscirosea]
MHNAQVDAKGIWSFLGTSLRHLAQSAGEQLEWIGPASIDDLALDFDAVYPAAWPCRDAGWISEELDSTLGCIDQKLASLTDDGPSAWTQEALRSNSHWEEIRGLASHALALMPVKPWNSSP